MASFNGTDMGPAVVMRTTAAAPQLQIMAYPEVNGLGVNILGSRGGTTEALGVLWADTPADLATAEQDFRTMQVGAAVGVLVDTTGTSWPGVILTEFRPLEEISVAPGYGYARAYRMEFLHTV